MSDLRKAAQAVLDRWDGPKWDWLDAGPTADLMKDLRAALAEPYQEPVAWAYVNSDGECEQIEYDTPPDHPSVTPLYAVPPQRKPLTDEKIKECERQAMVNGALPFEQRAFFARAIERAQEDQGE